MKHKHNKKTPLTLGALIDWGKAESAASEALRKRIVKTVWNDSRKVTKGDVFAALRSDSDDGHRYVQSAFEQGAIAAIVDKKGIKSVPEKYRNKCIVVSDTLKSLQKMAAKYRKEMGILIIGVTGSNGKTTTRSFISSTLKEAIKVNETYTNWNNHIGVPLSILKFDGDEWAGVLEMGANHAGEIKPLSKICAPDIAVITNIGYAHVGLFGSLEVTAQAKFEIAEGLHKDGFMLLNGDDKRLVDGARERGLNSVFFGMSAKCDVRAEDIKVTEKQVEFSVYGSRYSLSMPGRHFIYAALPAIYIAKRCSVCDEIIQEAIASLKPVSLRGLIEEKKGIRFIVDCYNANPSSMSSAIRYLTDVTPEKKRRVAVVGDMYELEQYTNKLHHKLGEELAKSDVQKVIAVGRFSEYIACGAVKAGLSSKKISCAADSAEAVKICRTVLKEGDTVLLKGSRGVGLERVFEGF